MGRQSQCKNKRRELKSAILSNIASQNPSKEHLQKLVAGPYKEWKKETK